MNIPNVNNENNPYQTDLVNNQQIQRNNPQPPPDEEVEVQQNRDEYVPGQQNETQRRGVAPLVNQEEILAGGIAPHEIEENNVTQAAPANENQTPEPENINPAPEHGNINPAPEPENANPAPEPERENPNAAPANENPNTTDRALANREYQLQRERLQQQLEATQNTARDNRSRILDLLV